MRVTNTKISNCLISKQRFLIIYIQDKQQQAIHQDSRRNCKADITI